MGTAIVGWAFESDIHCPDCARDWFGSAIDDDEAPPVDGDGNPARPVFATDESAPEALCGNCGAALLEGGKAGETARMRGLRCMPSGEGIGAFRGVQAALRRVRGTVARLVNECPQPELHSQGLEAKRALVRLEDAFADAVEWRGLRWR